MLVAVLIQTFATVAVIVQFEANRSYYAEVLCINKNRPELACQGKCVLMQRLNNEFQQEQQTTHHKLKNLIERELALFYQNIHLLKLNNSFLTNSKKAVLSPYSENFFPQAVLCSIFHPPAHRA